MKSMKKLVLAGLVLLASVMTLAGCKNDSVPETPKYTVTFDKNAENATGEMASQTFTQGEKKELAANAFVRPTWTFSGWSTNKEATTPEYGNKAQFSATKDTTLYAIWTDNGTVAPVTFTTQDGTKFFYDETVTVTLATNTEGATIEYKLDDGQWQDYSSPIEILSQNTITAKAKKEGLKDSEITSISYLRKLTSITITPPTRTVYSVGESFDSIDMVVTANYDDGEERPVEGTITSETSSLTETAGVKDVIVSYKEGDTRTATFTVDVVDPSVPTILTSYISPNHTDDTWTYVAFGEWPQTIKAASVEVTEDESKKKEMGIFTTYLGSDGNYYVKAAEEAYVECKYSNGDDVGWDGTSEKWFKVEPIIWRVLTKNYLVPSEDGQKIASGNALLLAENILTGGIPWDDVKDNYMESNIRKWLNGNSGSGEQSDYSGDVGFLQTAFTTSAQNLIAETTVDNSAASIIPNTLTEEQKKSDWYEGKNEYACDDTKDKIFLLSVQETTTEGYGFDVYNALGEGNTRIRVTTDYAKATETYHYPIAGYGGSWWQRSIPNLFNTTEGYACFVNDNGDNTKYCNVRSISTGVVPALSISMNGN